MSHALQNRLAWAIACERLGLSGFSGVRLNRPQGIFPYTHITARNGESSYFIGVTSREEIGADGIPNPSYNIVKTAHDLFLARENARSTGAIPAFVAIALTKLEHLYSAFFGTLEGERFRRSVPMLERDRQSYLCLAEAVRDERLGQLN